MIVDAETTPLSPSDVDLIEAHEWPRRPVLVRIPGDTEFGERGRILAG